MSEELERIMKKRLVKGGEFPPWFNFEEKGQKLLGKVISFREHPINSKTRVATIRTLEGNEYSVSLLAVLERLFTDQEVKVGDYVYIVYEGMGKSSRGRRVKLFSLAKMTAEEAEEIIKKAPPKPKEQPKPTEESEAEEKAEEKPEEKPSEKPRKELEIPEEKANEIREFFSRLFEFYDEGLTPEQLKERIERRFPEVTPEDVLEICDFLEFDEESKRFKKKESP